MAVVQENLCGSTSVVFPGDLHWRPNAVFQLVIGIDGCVVIYLLVLLIRRADHRTVQKVSGTVDGKTKFAGLAVGQLDPVHLPEVCRVAAAEADSHAGLVEAESQ